MDKFNVAAGNSQSTDSFMSRHNWTLLLDNACRIKLHGSSYQLDTNFEITEHMFQNALKVEGVETGMKVSRYCIEIVIGRMWNTTDTVKKVKEQVFTVIDLIRSKPALDPANEVKKIVKFTKIQERDPDLDDIFDAGDSYEPFDDEDLINIRMSE